MKKTLILFVVIGALASCGGNSTPASNDTKTATEPATATQDETRGIGKFTQVDIAPKLDAVMAEAGKKTYDLKCSSCHRLTDQKLVGPGWKDVTHRRKAEWIMNFVTNVDEMLNKDANAQAMLEVCLVRMPNQNVSDEEARNLYEFMRKNDGVK